LNGGEPLTKDEASRHDGEDRLNGADEGGTSGAEPLGAGVEGTDRHDARDGRNAEDREEGIVWDRDWQEVTPSGEAKDEDAKRGAGKAKWHRSERWDATTATRASTAL
jgi:hypothetical protein